MANKANPLPYIKKREYGIVHDLKATLFENRLSAAKNLYRKDLKCHFGCVNAIEFSSNGEILVSGGDDRRVMLWQFGQAIVDRGQPEAMKSTHQSNIFCLGITDDSKKIYSGGNDDMVIVHDVASKRPVEVLSHQRAVCCLSIDPYNDRVVSTAGNDGRLLLFDTRQSVHESLVISRSRKAFHGVMFHPTQKDILVSANARDGVALWDLKSPKRPLIRYTGTNGPFQNSMSVRFNKAGTHVLALRRRLPPVLYALYEQEPRAEFYHQDYYNSCTMKSCSFAGESDKYVLSGSDDFNLYLWKVPEPGCEDVVVESPHIVLYGHRSIVNQVRFNPQYSLIASSGVEKIIKLWSTMEYPAMRGDLLESATGSDNPREIYGQDDYVTLMHHNGQYISHNYADQSTSEDPRMMAFFDSLVQRELECLGESSESSEAAHHTDSCEEEAHLLADFLPLVLPPKIRISNSANRSQRGPNRLARLVASRYPKNSREAQKRGTVRRSKHLDRRALLSKFKMLPTRASAKGKQRSSGSSRRAPRGLENGPRSRLVRCARAGASGAGAGAAGAGAARRDPPSSERDEDEPRPLYRATGRNLRPLRRRMNLSRASKRKTKATNTSYRKSVMNLRSSGLTQDNAVPLSSRADYLDRLDSMALPSTSSGYRGENTSALFRVAADSDDQSGSGSSSPASVCDGRPAHRAQGYHLAFTTPGPYNNGSYTRMEEYMAQYNGDETRDSLIVEPPESDSTPPPSETRHRIRKGRRTGRSLKRIDSSESPPPKDQAIVPDRLSPKEYNNRSVARLMNETNESEVESSCSTEGSMWPGPGAGSLRTAGPTTPDSGVGTAAGSSERRARRAGDVSDDQDCGVQALKLRQRVKKARRNYRKHMESDSN
ncbi:DDB1- and CUL4-associated factor 5 [Cydia strobilella]|uniref:DDB1- and CUL4-associated factor 5 n=1 Tax=Cydia strobilella TaxID=1100964 RepID=UPI003003F25E